MGPDLLGIAGATAFLMSVLAVFAVVDRILCGAWEALNGSPGRSLVAGVTAWAREAAPRRATSSPGSASPGGSDPPQPADVVILERVRAPGLLPRRGESRFAAA